MTNEEAFELLKKIDEVARDYAEHEFGLPLFQSSDGAFGSPCLEMIEVVKAFIESLDSGFSPQPPPSISENLLDLQDSDDQYHRG
jgi:hypothetical protein